jgi:hypothetical protein
MKYELRKTELKSGKFLYEVVDENGNLISQRKSSRNYVACTIKGHYCFGRLDLIGKGDHGSMLRDIANNPEYHAKSHPNFESEISTIAYKN